MSSASPLRRSRTAVSIDATAARPPARTRKSSLSSLKSLSIPFRSKRKASDLQATHVEKLDLGMGLLSLPSELQVQVLNHLSFSDICALRTTCAACNSLITSPNSALARHWARFKLHAIQRQLYPAPSQGFWQYVVQQMHKWNVARHLAELLSHHVQYRTLLYHSAQKHLRYRPVALRIRRRMTPLLFLISHYLSSCEKYLLESGTHGSIPGPDWNGVQSSDRFELYTGEQIFAAHYAWLFLRWVFNQILNKPTYAGSVERAVRGWNTAPLDSNALTKVLIHGNLIAVNNFLRLKDYTERKKWALNFLAGLNPDQKQQKQPDWPAAWRNADMRDAEIPTKEKAIVMLGSPSTMDCLWTKGARVALSNHGIELEVNELHPNAAATIHFLTDLAGFGLFSHDAIPDNITEDEDTAYSEDDGETRTSGQDESNASLQEEAEEEEVRIVEEEGPESAGNYWDV
ncbi:hypothetical protein MBLNU459_g2618t1 [Dothideomycetes sp. NU459]